MSKSIVVMMQELNEQKNILEAEFRKNGKGALKEVAQDVFSQVEGLKKFVVLGYTPSFNDGEPCEHSVIYGWGNYRWNQQYKKEDTYYLSGDAIGEQEDLLEFLELEELSPYVLVDDQSYPIVYANSGVVDRNKADTLIGTVADACDILYHTNYIVYFTLEDDGSTVTVEHDDYDCGW